MDKRNIKKLRTKEHIVESAKQWFIAEQSVEVNTKDIAELAGVAHGTVFLHFKDKENLISSVIKHELIALASDLNSMVENDSSLDILMDKYLNYLISKESFMVVLAKEFPRMDVFLKQEMMDVERIIKDSFYIAFKRGVDAGYYKNIDSEQSLNFLFSSLSYYLANKELFLKIGSIIALKKQVILTTFYAMITVV
jgi:AcrR family transcriptional regulator